MAGDLLKTVATVAGIAIGVTSAGVTLHNFGTSVVNQAAARSTETETRVEKRLDRLEESLDKKFEELNRTIRGRD